MDRWQVAGGLLELLSQLRIRIGRKSSSGGRGSWKVDKVNDEKREKRIYSYFDNIQGVQKNGPFVFF